jgi:two-component system, LytTR family, response regulator
MSEKTIRTAIIDDEPTARRGVKLLLATDQSIELVGEAGDHAAAVSLIVREKPDLVFLDVQMPGGNGFAVLSAVPPALRPEVIFITAFDEYAVKAFEVNAIDYLLKPYEDGRFYEALERAKAAILRKGIEPSADKLAQLLEYLRNPSQVRALDQDRILIKSSGEIHVLKADEIDWIEAEGDYMKFHAVGRSYLMRETMARLEARLDTKRFVRIHRSVIVNIDRVRKFSPSFTGDYAVVLRDGTSLKLSRGYHDRLAEMLKLPP